MKFAFRGLIQKASIKYLFLGLSVSRIFHSQQKNQNFVGLGLYSDFHLLQYGFCYKIDYQKKKSRVVSRKQKTLIFQCCLYYLHSDQVGILCCNSTWNSLFSQGFSSIVSLGTGRSQPSCFACQLQSSYEGCCQIFLMYGSVWCLKCLWDDPWMSFPQSSPTSPSSTEPTRSFISHPLSCV